MQSPEWDYTWQVLRASSIAVGLEMEKQGVCRGYRVTELMGSDHVGYCKNFDIDSEGHGNPLEGFMQLSFKLASQLTRLRGRVFALVPPVFLCPSLYSP